MATTIHFVRHATYDLIGHAMGGRRAGWGLNAAGAAQAAAVAAALAHRPIRAVIAGPLQRARETAESVASRHALAVRIEPGLDEIDVGDWTERPFAQLVSDEGWQAWNRFRCAAPTPGGETMLAVQARAVAATVRLRDAWPDAEIVVVSHADVIKAVLATMLGLSLDLLHRFAIDPASRSVLVLYDAGAEVQGINLPPGA